MNPALGDQLNRIQGRALAGGSAGLVLCFAAAFWRRHQFFVSYLFGYLFWLGLALGCFSVMMIHYLTGGRWGYPVRRLLESGAMTLPVMALLFIPLFFGLSDLYPWARSQLVAQDEILRHKRLYMNEWAFGIRTVFFFGLWLMMIRYFRKWSLAQDSTSDAAPTQRLRRLSGPGIVIYPVTATFAYIDWLMSLESDWYSTIFVVIILIGQILMAFAFAIIMLPWFAAREPISKIISTNHYHNLGNLLLTFVIFWTYVAFSQFLIIWSGNLPHEIVWYLHRTAGGWKWVVIILAIFHFLLPFFLLLFRPSKRNSSSLALIATMVLAAHVINVFWLIQPTFHQTGISVDWMDFAALMGVGGIWIAIFIAGLKNAPLLPQHDPGLQFSVPYEH